MPDLGKYAEAVLSSYVVSIVLILALVAASMIRSRRMKRALQDVEKRARCDG